MRSTGVRAAVLVVFAAACMLVAGYLYPVGGRIWRADQVSGVAVIRRGLRLELADRTAVPVAARDALVAARLDRFRRLIPALRGGPCVPLDIALRTGDTWVDVPLQCTDGLLFDYISPDAWATVIRLD